MPIDETLEADMTLRHRAFEGGVTEVSARWTPQGFVVTVRSVKLDVGGGMLEGTHTLEAKLPRETRRKRGVAK